MGALLFLTVTLSVADRNLIFIEALPQVVTHHHNYYNVSQLTSTLLIMSS